MAYDHFQKSWTLFLVVSIHFRQRQHLFSQFQLSRAKPCQAHQLQCQAHQLQCQAHQLQCQAHRHQRQAQVQVLHGQLQMQMRMRVHIQ